MQSSPALIRLGDAGNADVNIRDLIPGSIINNTRLRKIKDPLESAYRIGGSLTVDAVGRDGRNGRIIPSNPVELFLRLLYFLSG